MNNTNTIKFIVKTFDDKSKVFTCSQNITILEFQKLLYSHIFKTNNTNRIGYNIWFIITAFSRNAK